MTGNSWCPGFGKDDYTLEHEERVFDGYFKVDRLTIRHRRFEGDEDHIVRELFRRGSAVCVLAYDPERDSVVMIEQFRVGAVGVDSSPWLLELVAGIVEPGESVSDVAIRESQEEAGIKLRNLRPISRFLPSAGACDEWIDLVYAEVDVTTAGGIHGLDSEGEDIKVHVLKADDAFALVESGAVNNGPAIIGLQWLQLHRESLCRS